LKLSVLIHRLIQEVQAGASLHTALTNSHMCDEWLIHIVKAAESSGQLDRLLAQQADHREQIQAQQSQIRTALAYPLFVLVIALCASAGLLHWVVPTFEDVFSSFNTELPWLTRQVLGMSRWVQSHGLATLVLLIFAALGMRTLYQRSPVLQKAFDRFTLRLPGCQSLIQRSQLARWCTTLHALTQAGVQMDQALSIVAPLCSNRTYQLACTDLIERMLRGQSLSNAMKHHPLCFDPLCIQMCALGEESGTLTTMLHKLATQYEQQMQHQVKRLGVLVEPAIMSVLGLLTGGLIAALYLPIFQMGQIL
jgi:type IV pilus assembly protein PilC